MACEWRIKLLAYGDNFDVDTFLKRHGTGNEELYHIGDNKNYSMKLWEENYCSKLLTRGIGSEKMILELENQILTIVPWSKAAHEFNGDVEIAVYVDTDGRDFPALNFTPDLLHSLSQANVTLDIDIMPSL